VLALVVIWGLLQTLGVDIVRSLREALIADQAGTMSRVEAALGLGG